MKLTERIANAIKAKLANDDEVYFRDDGDTCTIDGHVDMKALADAAIDAAHQELSRGEFKGRPCYMIKNPDAAVGVWDRYGDIWIMEIAHDGQPRCRKIEAKYLYIDNVARSR